AAKMESGFIWNDAVPGYPQTPEGQANFLRDLLSWGRETGVLSGIRPWGPEFAAPGWGPMSFFEMDGKLLKARPALSVFSEPAKAARHYGLCERSAPSLFSSEVRA